MSILKVNTITGVIDMPKNVKIKGGNLGVNFTVDSLGALPDSTSGDSFRPSAGDWFWDSGNETLKLYLNDSHGWKNIGLTDSAGISSGTPVFNRGLIFGGSTYVWPGSGTWETQNINYVTIETTGNATSFGDLVFSGTNGNKGSAGGDGTYAVAIISGSSTIEYVTAATTANATSFGTTYDGNTAYEQYTGNSGNGYHHQMEGFGEPDGTRMSYFNIATTGDATAFLSYTDFPNWTTSSTQTPNYLTVVCNDDIGWTIGGRRSNYYEDNMFSFTPGNNAGGASLGTGDLRIGMSNANATCDGTRAIIHCNVVGTLNSSSSVSDQTNVEYFDMQISSGTTTDFGDLTVGRRETAAFSSDTRACFAGGQYGSNYGSNIIDYVTTSTPGNASDFGDLTSIRNSPAGTGGAV